MEPKSIQRGALIELRDTESGQWLPLTIVSIVFDKVECRTLANEPILTTTSALIKDARLRPCDRSCRDCGDDAHEGPCIDRQCSECGGTLTIGTRAFTAEHSAIFKLLRKLDGLARVELGLPVWPRQLWPYQLANRLPSGDIV